MVAKAASGGKITSANKVQTSHVFSQFQLRVNFMGKVKLAFITPATSKIRKPAPAWSMFSPVLRSYRLDAKSGARRCQAQFLEACGLQLQLLSSFFCHNDPVSPDLNVTDRAPSQTNFREKDDI